MQNQFQEPEPSVLITPPLAPEPGTANEIVTDDTSVEQDFASQQTQTQAVDALLASARRKIQRRKRKFWGAFIVCQGALLFVLPLLCTTARGIDATLTAMILCITVGLAALAVMLSIMHRRDEFDPEELTRIGGVRAITPLLDSLSEGRTPASRTLIYSPLTELLPRMQASDATLLLPRHRRSLNALLSSETWPMWWGPKPVEAAFSLAVLKAYEQVGDAKAIPVVTKLASRKARTPRQRDIRQAALQCLPLLQSHAVPLDQTQTLLRPASQHATAPDILLRPAADTAPVPAAELLRATNAETKTLQ